MRALCFCLLTVFLIGCKTSNTAGDGAGVTTPPSGLEGPAYDPAAGPKPVGQMTMPAPPPAAPRATADPYGNAPAPDGALNTPMNPAEQQQQPKGDAPASAPGVYGSTGSAPQVYRAPTAAPQVYNKPIPATPAAALAQQITGQWVNGADEREMVAFTDDHYETYYDGELLIQEPMTYHAECPGDCSGGTPLGISCFTISGPAGQDCYGVVRLTADVLELSLLGVSTETMTYYRQQ